MHLEMIVITMVQVIFLFLTEIALCVGVRRSRELCQFPFLENFNFMDFHPLDMIFCGCERYASCYVFALGNNKQCSDRDSNRDLSDDSSRTDPIHHGGRPLDVNYCHT